MPNAPIFIRIAKFRSLGPCEIVDKCVFLITPNVGRISKLQVQICPSLRGFNVQRPTGFQYPMAFVHKVQKALQMFNHMDSRNLIKCVILKRPRALVKVMDHVHPFKWSYVQKHIVFSFWPIRATSDNQLHNLSFTFCMILSQLFSATY